MYDEHYTGEDELMDEERRERDEQIRDGLREDGCPV